MNLGGKPISPKTPFPRNQIRAQNSIPLNKTAYSRIVVYRIQKNYEFRRETHFPKSPISKKKNQNWAQNSIPLNKTAYSGIAVYRIQ